jgi:5'-nucleotidase
VKILLSNDDGYRAQGLEALALAIRPLGSIAIVAPDRNRSGASNSLTLDVPVRAALYDVDSYYVNGTPTDCVHLAISGLFDFEHDIVVSGVNDGANLGDDTLYSGSWDCRPSPYRWSSNRAARATSQAQPAWPHSWSAAWRSYPFRDR